MMPELFEVFWKSLAVFFLLVILTRMIGKKLLSQMTFFDFVIGISIGTIAGALALDVALGKQLKCIILGLVVKVLHLSLSSLNCSSSFFTSTLHKCFSNL